MCKYIGRKKLKEPKLESLDWINRVHKYMKEKNNITFQHYPIGSGKRNLVVSKCNSVNEFFDLDYEFELKSSDTCNPKEVKMKFKKGLDSTKPNNFTDCEDSTQALTTKSNAYGIDFIITCYYKNECYIIRNNKNKNNANNNDYSWALKKDCSNLHKKLKKVKDIGCWQELRDNYLEKKHKNKDITNKDDPRYKHSYQLLHEAVNEILKEEDVEI